MLGLLSATTYTRRFAWDLEETFAHIPFPADHAVFLDAARIGAEIRALETFAREPAAAHRSARLVGHASGVILEAGDTLINDAEGRGFVPLQADQSLRLGHLPEPVWRFAVSGYPVLPRWLAARRGEALDAGLNRAILDVAWRIQELLHWFAEADRVLDAAVAAPLTRAALGFVASGGPAGALSGDDDADDESPA